ncbi:hypothetical protein T06_8330 [Trichinella sp. T6]|uniref:Uncharacterized protein n=1 Tax=Trichinella murrelli TaxID=144512 RepID=A0A0V0UGP6_9BILA|nr:hypothetical protein T05_13745 [Trichinella murrelli]KRX85638.1 hypothetical protein T06_8330 [Trichinella sp. T6]KRZ97736.1 hypothetical protein T08_9650 [Trichinella sp. T8]
MSKDEDNGSKTENKSEVSLEDAMQHKLEKYEKMFKDRYSEKDSTFEKAKFPPALVVVGYRMRHFNRDRNRFPRDRFRRDHFAQDRFHRDRSPLDRF